MSLGVFLTILAITLAAFWWFTGGRRANDDSQPTKKVLPPKEPKQRNQNAGGATSALPEQSIQIKIEPKQPTTKQKHKTTAGIKFNEYGSPDMQSCFDVAFSRLSKQLSGIETNQLIELSRELKENDGAFEYQTKLMLNRLGTSDWRWSSYRKKLDSPQKYKEMTQNFIGMLGRTASALYRHEQRMQMTEHNPYWQFKRRSFDDSSEHCKAYDGVVKHYTDPFWDSIKLPCSPRCSCDIYTRSEQELARKGIMVGV